MAVDFVDVNNKYSASIVAFRWSSVLVAFHILYDNFYCIKWKIGEVNRDIDCNL